EKGGNQSIVDMEPPQAVDDIEAPSLSKVEGIAQRRAELDNLSDAELDSLVDQGDEIAREVQTLRTIDNEPIRLEDPDKPGGSGPADNVEPPQTPADRLVDTFGKIDKALKEQEGLRKKELSRRLS